MKNEIKPKIIDDLKQIHELFVANAKVGLIAISETYVQVEKNLFQYLKNILPIKVKEREFTTISNECWIEYSFLVDGIKFIHVKRKKGEKNGNNSVKSDKLNSKRSN